MNKNIHTFVVLAYKESTYLEDCINSVLNQSIKTNVVIATSTPNEFINQIGEKYNLKVIINKGQKGIAYDFNFAVNCVDSELVTVAHQDDIYEKDYAKEIIDAYKKNKNASIIFTDYFELRGSDKVLNNKNLKIKRILLLPLRIKTLGKYKFFRRWVLRFGNSICCPAVTFVKKNSIKDVFICDFKCNVDWYTWEKLSKAPHDFIFIPKPLMEHRISESSTTTDIINHGIRTKEDLIMFKKFWPTWFAKGINNFYKNSEKSNNLK